jgi:hypothetical protein
MRAGSAGGPKPGRAGFTPKLGGVEFGCESRPPAPVLSEDEHTQNPVKITRTCGADLM